MIRPDPGGWLAPAFAIVAARIIAVAPWNTAPGARTQKGESLPDMAVTAPITQAIRGGLE